MRVPNDHVLTMGTMAGQQLLLTNSPTPLHRQDQKGKPFEQNPTARIGPHSLHRYPSRYRCPPNHCSPRYSQKYPFLRHIMRSKFGRQKLKEIVTSPPPLTIDVVWHLVWLKYDLGMAPLPVYISLHRKWANIFSEISPRAYVKSRENSKVAYRFRRLRNLSWREYCLSFFRKEKPILKNYFKGYRNAIKASWAYKPSRNVTVTRENSQRMKMMLFSFILQGISLGNEPNAPYWCNWVVSI